MAHENKETNEEALKRQAEWDKKYPEMAKVRRHKEDTSLIIDFLNWINEEHKMFIAEWERGEDGEETNRVLPVNESHESLVGKYFDIDVKKFHKEKDQAMEEALEEQRKLNERAYNESPVIVGD